MKNRIYIAILLMSLSHSVLASPPDAKEVPGTIAVMGKAISDGAYGVVSFVTDPLIVTWAFSAGLGYASGRFHHNNRDVVGVVVAFVLEPVFKWSLLSSVGDQLQLTGDVPKMFVGTSFVLNWAAYLAALN